MDSALRPAPFSRYTTPEFWNDPHISARMLAHHLDPDDPAASRPHDFIERSAQWWRDELDLGPGSRVLDLGSGPGLYSVQLARHGVEVLAVDVSERSLAYLANEAEREQLPIVVRRANYLDGNLGSGHDAAVLIYEDYCVLSPDQRASLLGRVHDALRPGGRFLCDVTAAARFAEFTEFRREGQDLMGGFWGPSPYDATHERWTYPDLRLVLDRYVIDRGDGVHEFWNWTHCLTVDQVISELAQVGLVVTGIFGDVAGAPYDPDGPGFAVIARRPAETEHAPEKLG